MPEAVFVTVWFSDGHQQQWPLPANQTPDDALEELRQVIVTGQWFRPPESARAYSPYAIVAVDVAAKDDTQPPSVAHRLGEAVSEAISPTHQTD